MPEEASSSAHLFGAESAIQRSADLVPSLCLSVADSGDAGSDQGQHRAFATLLLVDRRGRDVLDPPQARMCTVQHHATIQ